jgi:hypothetical protein
MTGSETAVEDYVDVDARQTFKMNIKAEPTEVRAIGSRVERFLQLANSIKQEESHDEDSGTSNQTVTTRYALLRYHL